MHVSYSLFHAMSIIFFSFILFVYSGKSEYVHRRTSKQSLFSGQPVQLRDKIKDFPVQGRKVNFTFLILHLGKLGRL